MSVYQDVCGRTLVFVEWGAWLIEPWQEGLWSRAISLPSDLLRQLPEILRAEGYGDTEPPDAGAVDRSIPGRTMRR